MSDDKKYKIDDFWPEAEELLNQHFDAKKGGNKSAIWVISLFLIIAIAGSTFLYLNHNENNLTAEKQINLSVINDNALVNNESIQEKNTLTSKQNENTPIGNESISETDISQNIEVNKHISANNNDYLRTKNQEYINKNQINLPKQKSILKPSKEGDTDNFLLPSAENKNSAVIPVSTDILQTSIKNEYSNSTINESANSINQAVQKSPSSEEIVRSTDQSSSLSATQIIEKNIDEPQLITEKNIEPQLAPSASNLKHESSEKADMPNQEDSVSFNKAVLLDTTESVKDLKIQNDSNKNNKRINFGLYASAGMFNTSNFISVNEGYEAYKNRRNAEESSNLNTSFSLGFQVMFNRLIIKSGIELNSYGENINYSDWLNEQKTNLIPKWTQFTDSVSYTSYNYLLGIEYQGNETTYFQDSIQFFESHTSIEKTNTDLNSFRGNTSISYFEIPLTLSYILIQKSHLNFGVSFGGSAGFLSQKTGFYIDESMQNIIDLKSSNIIRKTVFNGRFGLLASYNFSNHSGIFIEPQYRISMQSILDSSVGTVQKYRSIGLSVGYSYSF